MLRKTEKEEMGRRAWIVAVEICRIGYSLQEPYESVNELERFEIIGVGEVVLLANSGNEETALMCRGWVASRCVGSEVSRCQCPMTVQLVALKLDAEVSISGFTDGMLCRET